MDADPADWRRRPGAGRYARPERERRFLVAAAPPGAHAERQIEDRYLDGTTLRLRSVRADGDQVRKLTQKVRAGDEHDPADVATTNLYLTADEHARLSALPGHPVSKTRAVVRDGATSFVVDTFHGHLQGLRLAEVEVVDLDAPLRLPGWLGPEVTHDDRFSGGRLAVADDAEVRALLQLVRAATGR